jgi:hypothetical protein
MNVISWCRVSSRVSYELVPSRVEVRSGCTDRYGAVWSNRITIHGAERHAERLRIATRIAFTE